MSYKTCLSALGNMLIKTSEQTLPRLVAGFFCFAIFIVLQSAYYFYAGTNMALNKVFLNKVSLKSIYDRYTYTTGDTLAECLTTGYFSGSPFDLNSPTDPIIEIDAIDGSTITAISLDDYSVVGVPLEIKGMPSAADVTQAVSKALRTGITRPTNIAFCGDSITRDSFGIVSASQSGWNDWGWVAWFKRSLNKSYTINSSDIFAVASQGTVHLLNTQLPQLISSGCGVCITMIGTNDLGLSIDVTGNLAAFYDALSENNIKAVALPILPHNSPDSLTAAEAQEASKINRWLADRALIDSNMTYLSSLDTFTDYSTGDAIAAYLRDGIHTTKQGAKVVGGQIAAKFNAVFAGAEDAEFAINGNKYDATINPNGNITTNPYMNGTAGALANGATGSVATGCLVYRSAPTATFGLVASKETINNLAYQVATLSGTGDADIAIIEQSVSLPTGWIAGDKIRGRVYIETDFVGVSYFAVGVWCPASVGYDGGRTSANGSYPQQNSGTWSAEVEIPSGATTAKISVYAETENGAALSGTIKVSQMFIEKIS